MPQSGRELKARLAQLMRRHNVRPIARDPIPLLPPTAGSQIIEAIAASADVDADRMSFARGSLSWPDDLSKLPLLVRHSATGWLEKYSLSLDYDDRGNLYLKALVEDSEARRMGGISIAATVIESEVRDEDSPVGFHFVITKAIVDEISLSPVPANPRPACMIFADVSE